MNDYQDSGNEFLEETELMSFLTNLDDDLVDNLITEFLSEKGDIVNIDSIKKKALSRLENSNKKHRFGKRVFAAVFAAVLLTVSTVYANDIQKALQAFFGKSVVYDTVVDGDAYYLPNELDLNEIYRLKYVNMSENRLEIEIENETAVSDKWYSEIEVSVISGTEHFSVGGYSINNNSIFITFHDIKPIKDFQLLLDGRAYDISLEKAERLKVDAILEEAREAAKTTNNVVDDVVSEKIESSSPIANVAVSRSDSTDGVNIRLAVSFNDPNMKLVALGEEDNLTEDEMRSIITEDSSFDLGAIADGGFYNMFENGSNGVVNRGNGPHTKPLMAYDADDKGYTLNVPNDIKSWPVSTFETNAAPGTKLTVKVPAIVACYAKEVDNIKLTIPETGEVEVSQEVDFVIQNAVIKSIKRTSETNAEIIFDLNTGADKSVKIRDISAYSKNVKKSETVICGDTAVMRITFDKSIKKANFQFSWPRFIINGNWSIELN